MRFLAFIISLFSSAVLAQPLTVITPAGPGSMADTAARHFAPALEAELGRPVVIQNVPGANGLLAMQALMKNKDAVLVGGTVQGYVAATVAGLDFDPMTDIEPIHGLVQTQQQILVAAGSSIRSLADFKGRTLNGGSAHPSTQMTMGLLDTALGSTTIVVGYKQVAQVAVDVASGVVDYTVGGVGNGATQGMLDAGKLRAVGLVSDVPVEGFSWNGWFVKRGAGDATLRAGIAKVMRSPEAKLFEQRGRALLMTDGIGTAALQRREFAAIKRALQ